MSTSSLRNEDMAFDLLHETYAEMVRQDEKWGWPRPPQYLEDDHTVVRHVVAAERAARSAFADGNPSWSAILAEEAGEVTREADTQKRIQELVQVAAVALSWAHAIRLGREREGDPIA